MAKFHQNGGLIGKHNSYNSEGKTTNVIGNYDTGAPGVYGLQAVYDTAGAYNIGRGTFQYTKPTLFDGNLNSNFYSNLEFNISADELYAANSGSDWLAGTAYTISDVAWAGFNSPPSQAFSWSVGSASSFSTITNQSGSSVRAMDLPVDANLQTSSNLSHPTTCATNGGWTFWMTLKGVTTQSSWMRPFNYVLGSYASSGLNTGTNVSVSTAEQYNGMLIFFNGGSDDIQIRVPDNVQYASGYYLTDGALHIINSSFDVATVVISQVSTTTVHVAVQSSDTRNSPGGVENESYTTLSNYSGAYNTSNNLQRPMYLDNTYWSDYTGGYELIESGWVNYPLASQTQTLQLARWINDYWMEDV